MSVAELLEGLDRAAAGWGDWMVSRGIDGLVALAATLALLRVLRRASPHFRSALLALSLLPLVVPMPRIARESRIVASVRGALVAGAERLPWLAPEPGAAHASLTSDAGAGAPRPAPPSAPAARPVSGRSLAFLAWLAVALGLLARWLAHERRLRLSLRAGRLLPPAGFPAIGGARVRVVECDAIAAPATTGWLHPTIVLPATLRATLSGEELRFVLLHELAHVRRGDLWTGALERLVRIAWFFHPAPWIAGRLLATEREAACDDSALSRFPRRERHACAAAFLKVVELAGAAPPARAIAAALAPTISAAAPSRDGRNVRSRVMRMIGTRRIVAPRLAGASWLGLAACAAALLLVLQPARGLAQTAPRVGPPPRPAAAAPDLHDRLRRGADWLLRHQDPNGYWDADGFASRCRGERCEGKGQALHDVGVTGLALLALTRTWELGPDARIGSAIERANAYLHAVQDEEDGCFGAQQGQHFMYGHALATLALAELEAAAPSKPRAAALRRAVAFLERARNPYRGWRYACPADGDNDASMTSTVEIALGAALEAGIPVPAAAIDDGLKLLDDLTDPASGRTGYHERGSLPAREPEDMDRWPAAWSEAVTAAALHARAAHDVRIAERSDTLRGLALLSLRRPVRSGDAAATDLYYWFHGTAALRAAGGAGWTAWRDAVVAALEPFQRESGDAAGSFDPHVDPWGDQGGRVYSTAICLLTLAAATH